MSDLPQQNTIVQYVADGISTNYTVPFFTPVERDGTPNLDVYVQAPLAVPLPANDIQIWNEAYIYTENLDPITGGTITFLAGHIPANGYIVTIVRDVSASLDVEFSQAQTFSGFTLDAALDKLLLISQQNKSYALDRNLSYIVNSYLPEATLQSNVQIPVLQEGYIWMGSAGGVIAAFLQQPADVSTLRSELANNQPSTDGARLVGYYDSVNSNPTTVDAQLTYLTNSVVAPFPTGVIVDFGGTSAPAGFLECDGTIELIADYPDLYAVIGNIWGGDGITTFARPNLQHRVTMGAGGTTTNPTIGTAVGDVGGEDMHTQAANEVGVHTHNASGSIPFARVNTQVPYQGSNPPVNPVNTSSTSLSIIIDNNSGGDPFNIIQKSAVVLKIIKT